jgi:hypothetical protein
MMTCHIRRRIVGIHARRLVLCGVLLPGMVAGCGGSSPAETPKPASVPATKAEPAVRSTAAKPKPKRGKVDTSSRRDHQKTLTTQP